MKTTKAEKEQKNKDFDKLAKAVEIFLNKWGNPHMTVIVTQQGIEVTQGDMAMPFKVKD